jgi:hypothetical protein
VLKGLQYFRSFFKAIDSFVLSIHETANIFVSCTNFLFVYSRWLPHIILGSEEKSIDTGLQMCEPLYGTVAGRLGGGSGVNLQENRG